MHQSYKTIYFPKVSVIHGYESGANNSKRLFKIYINSTTTQNISIKVYNPIGKMIHSFSDNQVNTLKKTYDFSSYASGLYHVVIKTAHTEKHHKLILN